MGRWSKRRNLPGVKHGRSRSSPLAPGINPRALKIALVGVESRRNGGSATNERKPFVFVLEVPIPQGEGNTGGFPDDGGRPPRRNMRGGNPRPGAGREGFVRKTVPRSYYIEPVPARFPAEYAGRGPAEAKAPPASVWKFPRTAKWNGSNQSPVQCPRSPPARKKNRSGPAPLQVDPWVFPRGKRSGRNCETGKCPPMTRNLIENTRRRIC